jgi:hypothetical protein
MNEKFYALPLEKQEHIYILMYLLRHELLMITVQRWTMIL